MVNRKDCYGTMFPDLMHADLNKPAGGDSGDLNVRTQT